MKILKTLSVSLALTLVLAVSAFAAETQALPCAPTDPGEMSSPPCPTTQLTPDDSMAPAQTETPQSAASTVPLAEVAVDVVQSVLMLF